MGTDLEWDLARLLEVYRLAHAEQRRLGIDELWLTADTNEMCDTPQYMVELLVRLREENRAAFDSLLYVEQTCERDLRKRMLDMAELREVKPVILDDALSSLEDLELALELGYSGLALKTCKCQSTELVLAPRAGAAGAPFAVQDLTNPGIALLQSAGLAGRLQTIRGVDSNSRQFFPASSETERAVHPGFFKLEQERIRTSTLRGTGLGYQWDRIDRRLNVERRLIRLPVRGFRSLLSDRLSLSWQSAAKCLISQAAASGEIEFDALVRLMD